MLSIIVSFYVTKGISTNTNLREQAGAVYPTEQELSAIVRQVRAEKLEATVVEFK